MNTLYKTVIMGVAAVFITTGVHAEGDKNESAQKNGNAEINQEQTANQPATIHLNSQDVMDIQESLNEEGYSLAVTGIWDENSADALLSFQRQHEDLPQTGDLDSQTIAKLGVDVDGDRDMW